jgi:hypothetical protein
MTSLLKVWNLTAFEYQFNWDGTLSKSNKAAHMVGFWQILCHQSEKTKAMPNCKIDKLNSNVSWLS